MSRATDPFVLDSVEKDVKDAAENVQKLWLVYVSYLVIFAALTATVDDLTLLRGGHLEIPLLKMPLPLVGFFSLGPIVAVSLHAYFLMQLAILSRKLGMYEDALSASVLSVRDRTGYRQRLSGSPFVQYLCGVDRDSYAPLGVLVRLLVISTAVILPIFVLLLSLLTFLPYHDARVSWIGRISILIVLALLAAFWPRIARLGQNERPYWTSSHLEPLTYLAVWAFASIILVQAVFPGEYLDFSATRSLRQSSAPQAYLVSDYDPSGRRNSLFRTTLVVKDRSDVWTKSEIRDLKGRDLSGAVFDGSDFRSADFREARMQKASLRGTRLQEADLSFVDLSLGLLDLAELQGASLSGAILAGASLIGIQAQGANLIDASLQAANLEKAQLQGASLRYAKLSGANFRGADLQAARLDSAYLIGARLREADIRGASLDSANLQGVVLDGDRLNGASLIKARLWRSRPSLSGNLDAKMRLAELDFSAEISEVAFVAKAKSKAYYDELVDYLCGNFCSVVLVNESVYSETVREHVLRATSHLRPEFYSGVPGNPDPVKETRDYENSWRKLKNAQEDEYSAAASALFKEVSCRGNDDAIEYELTLKRFGVTKVVDFIERNDSKMFYHGAPYAAIGVIKYSNWKALGAHTKPFVDFLAAADQCVGVQDAKQKVRSLLISGATNDSGGD